MREYARPLEKHVEVHREAVNEHVHMVLNLYATDA